LAGILLLQSIIVAAVFMPRPHGGGDNAGYISLAHSLLDRGNYLELWTPEEPPHTKYPPVFPLILAGAILLGAKSWAALKLIPAFSTVLAVAFTFLWARDRRGLGMGVAVALLVGLSESVVYYSQWILSDPTFLALTMAAMWALEKRSEGAAAEEAKREGGRWLAVGAGFVVLAYFTRSAGFPLALAAALWLGLERKWKALVGFSAAFGIPAFLWWLRGYVLGGSQYVSEFWLVDPYRLALGRVGPGGLVERLIENLGSYVTQYIPAGVVGGEDSLVLPLGIVLGSLTAVGWFRCLRKEVGTGELFFPLYFGLILLWPPAWSGDRFALPLLPFIFFYSGVALLFVLSALPVRVRRGALGVLLLVLALPAGRQWTLMAKEAGSCRALSRMGISRECLPSEHDDYFTLAEWSGENLPDAAVVTTRKPRIFFLMSGVKTRPLPLLEDPDEFLARVREGGSRYVSLDHLAGSGYYVYPALLEHFSSFCGLVEIGAIQEIGTHLLGLLGPGGGTEGEASETLARCPTDMFRASPREGGSTGGWRIPLLSPGPEEGG